ncbi:cytochrome c oxidase subunit II [Oscillatoria salina]|uniref:cytochrome c oxidase subunit II n=1 Tax=Oscillatoria salina TaxID=331517 RepID=UPI0013B838E9|nr:cytochrome c oxidase subunit II [Oscillatoria salina]MBZ8179516.1 cytochrome c oxidase subunit II [Oscillatoria salina IIICB1]NET87740.1 cytochrome c oxidase subunit II [Kamptonema sp. SIO1D9]
MKKTNTIIIVAVAIAIVLPSLWYGQNHGLLPIAASEEAKSVDSIFNLMMTVATALFLLIQGVLVYTAIKFRRRQGDETDGPNIEGNVPLEIVWTAIPTIIVLVISIYSFEVYNEMGGLDPMSSHDPGPQQLVALDPSQKDLALGLGASPENQGKEPYLNVNVNGIQYAWIFTYPDTGVITGELHVPVGKEVRLNLSAGDVLHAFWLPEFRIKQDAIPGREAEIRFTPTLVGTYPIICAELCGAYHGAMKSQLFVQSEEDYQKWVEEQTQVANANNWDRAVASNLSDREFLAPYAEEMGINQETLAQLTQLHHH